MLWGKGKKANKACKQPYPKFQQIHMSQHVKNTNYQQDTVLKKKNEIF